jgi:hypothetical protein
MGTRADFYVGRGAQAEWLGSVAYDGYPDGPPEPILSATSADDFRERVRAVVTSGDDGTLPEQGWPWPWDTSSNTDYAYAYDAGRVWISCFGCAWVLTEDDLESAADKVAVFPDMSARKAVAAPGSSMSGAMAFVVKG